MSLLTPDPQPVRRNGDVAVEVSQERLADGGMGVRLTVSVPVGSFGVGQTLLMPAAAWRTVLGKLDEVVGASEGGLVLATAVPDGGVGQDVR